MAIIDLNPRALDLSIRRLAEEFAMARETIAKRLTAANVRPSGTRSGHPVYRLRDVCPALFANAALDENGEFDPRQLKPSDRLAWYRSEHERVQLLEVSRQLIPAIEVQSEMAEMVRLFVQFLDTLGDQLERDVGLDAMTVDALNKSVAKHRAKLYAHLHEVVGDVEGVQ